MSEPRGWLEREVLVTVGTGGVGKTTISAAVGLAAARAGKNALILTIDPARRLADALGTGPLGHEPSSIPDAMLLRAGALRRRGSLSAMMLDTKRTFDELVRRHAPHAEAVERIFSNPLYQNLSDALAGSREYGAMEKLLEIHDDAKYDLIVVDTPPSNHAVEFLDAPRRLRGFLESQLLRAMFRPALAMGRTGVRLFRFGSETVLRVMERATGLEFLRAASDFLLAFEDMLEGFTSRAQRVESLLRDARTGFLLVVGPDPEQTRLACEFWARLERERIQLAGAIVNRVRPWPVEAAPPRTGASELFGPGLVQALATALPSYSPGERAALLRTALRHEALAARDRLASRALARELPVPRGAVVEVPLLSRDVHALASLDRIAQTIFGATG